MTLTLTLIRTDIDTGTDDTDTDTHPDTAVWVIEMDIHTDKNETGIYTGIGTGTDRKY